MILDFICKYDNFKTKKMELTMSNRLVLARNLPAMIPGEIEDLEKQLNVQPFLEQTSPRSLPNLAKFFRNSAYVAGTLSSLFAVLSIKYSESADKTATTLNGLASALFLSISVFASMKCLLIVEKIKHISDVGYFLNSQGIGSQHVTVRIQGNLDLNAKIKGQ